MTLCRDIDDDASDPVPAARPAKRQRLTREARHAQLVSCALEVFAREGVGRASHQDVAREAGTSTPTVFFYFPTRRDLVDIVLSSVEQFFMDVILSAPGDLPARAALLRMGEAFVKGAPEDLLKIKIWLDWSTSFHDDVWPRFLRLQRKILSHEQGIIEQGQRAGTVSAKVCAENAARIVHGGAHMIALMMFERCQPEQIHLFLERLIDSALGQAAG